MEGSRRGLHLAAYAGSAGKAKKKKERLTPTQYIQRKPAADGAKVVVLLLGHKGVSRPDAWLGLIDACPAVALLVHAEVELPERLAVWRFPRSQVTAWEDITLFVLIRRMLKYALNAYRHATIVYTCSGDGIPIVNGDTLERPWAHVGLPEGSPILGINPNDTRITVPEWEPIRQSALADHGLPPMPVACYGSQWVGLTRSDAEAVVAAGEKYGSALAGAYRTAYAHAVDGHGQGHARLHPDEEYLPYVLLVLSARPWPEVYGCVMAEATDASPSRCPLCRFRVGHGAVLTPAREERVRTRLSPSCLFLRKVTPLQEAGRRQEEEQLQEARQRQEEEHQERQQQHEQQQQEPQQQGHEGSTSEGGGSYTGTRARSRPHAHVRMHPYIHTHVSPPSHTYPHTHTHTHTHTYPGGTPEDLLADLTEPATTSTPHLDPAAVLARDGYVLLRGAASAELCEGMLRVAGHVNWQAPGRQLRTQPLQQGTSWRLGCVLAEEAARLEQLDPYATGTDTRLAGRLRGLQVRSERELATILAQLGHPNRPVSRLSILHTRPGAKAGHWHTDAPLEAQGMLTVLLAATPRDFHFQHLADPIHLEPCDVLVFNALLCHKGAAHAAQAEQASVAAHAYCGTEMVSFNNTFECLGLDDTGPV